LTLIQMKNIKKEILRIRVKQISTCKKIILILFRNWIFIKDWSNGESLSIKINNFKFNTDSKSNKKKKLKNVHFSLNFLPKKLDLLQSKIQVFLRAMKNLFRDSKKQINRKSKKKKSSTTSDIYRSKKTKRCSENLFQEMKI